MIIDFTEALYSYDRLMEDANCLAKKYEGILQCVTIGSSHDNRDIILLKLGLGQKYIVCCAGVHGRETINPIVMMKMIETYSELYISYNCRRDNLKRLHGSAGTYLEEEYGQIMLETCIYELLQTYTILFVPLLNPDGYMIALFGFDSICNEWLRYNCQKLAIPYQDWKANARGVDINRNFPSRLWKPKNVTDYPASENETKALMELFQKYPSKGFLDFHSRGKIIYYYRSVMPNLYNGRQYDIAVRFKEITGYELVPPNEEIETGDTGGNTVHYFSENFGKPAFTIETVEDEAEFPLDSRYRYPTYEEIKWLVFEFGSRII